MDIFDILDIFVDPIVDFSLCEGNFGVWLKKRFMEFLLTAGLLICTLSLSSAIRALSVIRIVVWAIGTAFVVGFGLWYAGWWIREGRFGAELPFLDKIPLPKGDLMNKPPEDTPFGVQPPEDIWEKMGVK